MSITYGEWQESEMEDHVQSVNDFSVIQKEVRVLVAAYECSEIQWREYKFLNDIFKCGLLRLEKGNLSWSRDLSVVLAAIGRFPMIYWVTRKQ